MPQCAVSTCRNNHRKTKGRRVRYHRFPAEDDVRSRWVSVCGRSFNTATARVCSLHFSPHSYERDVEHELLGLPPRSRLKRGAVPDRAVPISLPSLISKLKQPRQRQQQVNSSKRGGRKPRPPQYEEEEEAAADRDVTTDYDILLALGLTPIKKNHQDGDDYDLNRMHVMEDEGSKPSAILENLPKTNGSPTPCQNAVPTLDSEKKGASDQEDVATGTNKDESQQKVPSSELLGPSKHMAQEEEEEIHKDREGSDAENKSSTSEIKHTQTADQDEKGNEASGDDAPEAEKMPTESEIPSTKKMVEHNNKPQQDDLCSLPPSPEDDDENSATSSPESQGVVSKRSQNTRRKHISSDSDSDTPAIVKKLKLSSREYEERERMVNEYVDSASRTGLEEIQKYTEKLQQEIHTLNTLARAKEHEWNNIIRLKKVKEEMYLRLQRKRQVILLTMGNVTKPSDTMDWDLSSDTRFGECSVGIGGIPSSGDSASLKASSTKINSKEQNTVSQFNLQPPQVGGMSVLKSSQNQLPLMMVPIVSSGPGGLTASLSTSTVPSQSTAPSASSIKVPDLGNRDKSGGRIHRPILPKPTTAVLVPSGNIGTNGSNNNGQNPVIGEGRQGPILDVRSIIADYRSRHPETVPRRGRRLKSSLSPTPNAQQLTDNLVSSTRVSGGGGILSMASLALGSGSQMRSGLVGSAPEVGDISFFLNAVGEAAARQDTSRPSSADSSRSGAPSHATPEPGSNANSGGSSGGISFKDVLVQFAKLSQTEQRHEPLPATTTASKPPPYPEVTLHPVLAPHSPPHQSPSSSLLHGILTKSNNAAQHRGDTSISARPTTFSPTLARLLTAPERLPSVISTNATTFHGTAAHVSISDLLSTSKTRNEITITPVAAQPVKAKEEVVLVEEEQEDSADRLVIDESGDGDGRRSQGENEDDQGPEMAAEDVPECQGCHQRAAQFVCAGCGNQWYCSRDCQVSAWDEHSEVCSG